jgi:hypothetical protein
VASDKTGSNRPIAWITLPPLPLLPLEHVWKETLWYTNADPQYRDRKLRYLLSLSGGHPRSLALLKDVLSLGRLRLASIGDLRRKWHEEFMEFVIKDLDDDVFQHLVLIVLRGEYLTLDSDISGWRVDDLLQNAALLNEVQPNQPFKPLLPLLRFDAWCCNRLTRSIDHNFGWGLKRLKELIDVGEKLDGASFENFMFSLEELRCWAFCQGGMSCGMSIQDYWPSATVIKSVDGETSRKFLLPSPVTNHQQKLPKNLSKCSGLLQPGHYRALRQQPGFDNLHVMEQGMIMFVECRYSEPPTDESTGTKLSPFADVRRKVSLVKREIKECQATVGGVELCERNSVVVVSAFRDPANQALSMQQFRDAVLEKPQKGASKEVEQAFVDFSSFEGTVLVMDRVAVLEHCGPTLSRLGGFVLDHNSQTSLVVSKFLK